MKNHLKLTIKNRIIHVATAVAVAVLGFSLPAFAATPTSVTGSNIQYTAYTNVVRTANFTALADSTSCTTQWNVAGSYDVAFTLKDQTTQYTHAVTLHQNGTTVTGNGTYPTTGTPQYKWKITSGSVNNKTITLTANYTKGSDATNPQTTMTMTGTIASDGTMSGTWSDNYQGTNRKGTWTTTSGNATQKVVGCQGFGQFRYSDASNVTYRANIRFVSFSKNGNNAWFAGPVAGNGTGAGKWLFAEVHDGGRNNSDQIWGSFVTKNEAKVGVANQTDPTDGPFDVTSGNITIQ